MWKCLLDVNTESRETGSSGLGLWIYTVSALGSPTGLQNDREKYSIADSKIIFIRMFLLKHVTVNATTVKRKNWSKWLICQGMLWFYEHSLPWNITILKWRSFISVSRLKMQTFKVHTSPKHHSKSGSQCYNTWAKMKVNVTQSHIRLLKDWVGLSKLILTTESLAAQIFMLWCSRGQKSALKEVREYQHVKHGSQ